MRITDQPGKKDLCKVTLTAKLVATGHAVAGHQMMCESGHPIELTQTSESDGGRRRSLIGSVDVRSSDRTIV